MKIKYCPTCGIVYVDGMNSQGEWIEYKTCGECGRLLTEINPNDK